MTMARMVAGLWAMVLTIACGFLFVPLSFAAAALSGLAPGVEPIADQLVRWVVTTAPITLVLAVVLTWSSYGWRFAPAGYVGAFAAFGHMAGAGAGLMWLVG